MNRAIAVEPLVVGNRRERYHLLGATLGYEKRARNLAEQYRPMAATRIAWAFDHSRTHSFDDNAAFFRREGFEIAAEKEGAPPTWIQRAGREVGPGEVMHMCVDISSTTRARMAQWIEGVMSSDHQGPVEVDFFYSEAKFQAPPPPMTATLWAGPVTSAFAGWTDDPAKPSALVIGLGYEPERAIGAVELIAPSDVVVFFPMSDETRFGPAVQQANSEVFALHPKPREVRYRVDDPYSAFLRLEGVLSHLSARARPVVIPFGPKIFALHCLIAAMFHRNTGVWRVSAGLDEPPIEREPTGNVFGLRLKLGGDSGM